MEQSKKPHRYKKRVISGFTTLVLLLAVVGCLYIVLQSLSNGYVKCGKTSLFRVVTGSMEPTIPVNALLMAKETDIKDVREGDIVCFRSTNPGSEGLIVTHRVVRVLPDSNYRLITKGDNPETNPTVDINPVTEQNLIGRVTWHTGDDSTMAKIINFLTEEFGFMACIVLPVMLIAVWVFRDASKNLRKEIAKVEADLEQKEAAAAKAAQQPQDAAKPEESAMTKEEYDQLRKRIEEELRKEMEQHAPACEDSDTVAQEDSPASAAALSDETAPLPQEEPVDG